MPLGPSQANCLKVQVQGQMGKRNSTGGGLITALNYVSIQQGSVVLDK